MLVEGFKFNTKFYDAYWIFTLTFQCNNVVPKLYFLTNHHWLFSFKKIVQLDF